MKQLFSKMALWLVVLPLILSLNASAAVTASISPSVISNTYSGQITLQISGLGTGESVIVRKFYDVNTNGTVDAADLLVQQFQLTDGQATTIAGVTNINVPGDWNSTNGTITAPLNNFQSFVGSFAGKFAYVISSPSNHFSPPITNFITVTNFSYSQSITGTVKSGVSAIANATVFALAFANGSVKNVVDGAAADNSGNYSLKVPPGTYLVAASKSNYVGTFAVSPVTLGAGVSTNLNLSLTAAASRISGKMIDSNTPNITLPGIFVTAMSTDNLIAVSFTDTSGNFSIPVTASQWKVQPQDQDLSFHGYVRPANSIKVSTVGGNVTGLNLGVFKATALAYGTVKDGNNNPLPGLRFYGQDNNNMGNSIYEGDASAISGGNYVMGLVPAQAWDIEVDTGASGPQFAGYLFSQPAWSGNAGGSGGTNIVAGMALRQDFTALIPTNQIVGHLKDNAGNPISGIQVNATADVGGKAFYTQVDTDANGYYSLNAVAGQWTESVGCGCSDCGDSLSNSNQCPYSEVFVVSGSTVTNDIIVQPSGSGPYQIAGTVLDETTSQPIGGINVYAIDDNGNVYTTVTYDNGNYGINNVGNGNVTVSLDCGGLSAAGYSCPASQSVPISNNSYNGLNFNVQNCGTLAVTTTSPLPDGFVGENYSLQLENSGCNAPFTWTLTPGSLPLPANLTLSTNGLISGVLAGTGTNHFSVRVTDNFSATADLLVELAVYNPILITNTSLPAASPGAYYQVQLGATGGLPPYYWTPVSLPAWLNLDGSGDLYGTPSAGGTYPVTVSLMDSDGNPAETNLSVTVGAALQITTVSLANATAGVPYNSQLQASGGTPPYYWTLAAGSQSLPSNLNLSTNGVISGTPAVSSVGTNSFIVQVTDFNSVAVTHSLGLIVNAKPTLNGATRLSNTQFRANVSGAANQNYSFQYSTNLSSWFTLYATNPATSSFQVIDNSATNKNRFYRLLLGP